jgi:ABC-2 type transport system permease protein
MPNALRQFLGFFKASFTTLLRTPSAWTFGFLFPVVFVILFGFISTDSKPEIKIGLVKDDASFYQPLKKSFESVQIFKVTESEDRENLEKNLEQGNLDGVIRIDSKNEVVFTSNANKPENVSVIKESLEKINTELTLQKNRDNQKIFKITESKINSRQSNYIDFVLPGILGYSIMSAAVFGVAFSFFTLRKDKVLKRLFASPAKVSSFILGEAASRSIFILLQNLALILVAAIIFQFSPRNGFLGLLEMGVVMFIGLLVFLGFGYSVAGFAKSDEVATPIANLFVFPQFILAGTFFPVSSLPSWLAFIAKLMPLYSFNQAIRYITIDGMSIFSLPVLQLLGFLSLWGFASFFLASKVFRVK